MDKVLTVCRFSRVLENLRSVKMTNDRTQGFTHVDVGHGTLTITWGAPLSLGQVRNAPHISEWPCEWALGTRTRERGEERTLQERGARPPWRRHSWNTLPDGFPLVSVTSPP